MSNRVIALALAFIDGIAALQLYLHGMAWFAFSFIAVTLCLLVGIDRNDSRRQP